MNLNQGFPSLSSKFVDPETGFLTEFAYQFLLSLWNRTGAAVGSGSGGPAKMLSVGASPFIYIAPQNGALIVSGQGVSALDFSRDGARTWYSLGSFYGSVGMLKGDQIRVTYPGAPPSVEFVPF